MASSLRRLIVLDHPAKARRMICGYARLSMCGQNVDAQVKHLGRIDPSSAVTESTMESAAAEASVEPAKVTEATAPVARVAAPSIVVIRVAAIGSRHHRS